MISTPTMNVHYDFRHQTATANAERAKTANMTDAPVIYVVDDDPAMLALMAQALATNGWPVETFGSAPEFLAKLDPRRRGCLLVDYLLPEMNGLQLAERLRSQGVQMPIVVVSGQDDVRTVVQAIKAGAVNYLVKPFTPEALVEAINEALTADVGAPQDVPLDDFQMRLAALTEDEQIVLRGMALGMNNAQIAAEMDSSVRTVQFRRAAMIRKLGVYSKVELMQHIFRCGWTPAKFEKPAI